MRRYCLSAMLALLVLAPAGARSQSQIIETQKGKIELVGLEQWNAARIEKTLNYDSRDRMFYDLLHDLTGKLGFAAATCAIYVEDGKAYKVLTVLEPERSGQVQYLPAPSVSLPIPTEWRDLLPIIEEKKFVNTVLDYGSISKGAITTETLFSPEEKAWFTTLQRHQSRRDYSLALERLSSDGDYGNRVIAALILNNFSERNRSWIALMDGLRDSDQWVRQASAQSLLSLVKYTPRTVDWSPAIQSLQRLLSGTNIIAFQWVIEILVKTNVSAKLGPKILKGDSQRLVLAYLTTTHQHERDIAHQVLVQLYKRDFGFDDGRWSGWIKKSSPSESAKRR